MTCAAALPGARSWNLQHCELHVAHRLAPPHAVFEPLVIGLHKLARPACVDLPQAHHLRLGGWDMYALKSQKLVFNPDLIHVLVGLLCNASTATACASDGSGVLVRGAGECDRDVAALGAASGSAHRFAFFDRTTPTGGFGVTSARRDQRAAMTPGSRTIGEYGGGTWIEA